MRVGATDRPVATPAWNGGRFHAGGRWKAALPVAGDAPSVVGGWPSA